MMKIIKAEKTDIEQLSALLAESFCHDPLYCHYIPYEEAAAKYNPEKLTDGFNTVDGEEILFISNPALGLWVCDD